MLQRTVSRTGGGGGPGISWRPVLTALGVVLALLGTFALLPKPGPRVRPSGLDGDALVAKTLSHRLAPAADPSRGAKRRAALGAKLFADAGLSPSGKACESCHVPEKSYTDGKTSPTLVNVRENLWLMRDGRADSLAAAALKELEDPRAAASSRAFVVAQVKKRYAADYEEAFGALPLGLKNEALPADALPVAKPVQVPIELSAYALSTLGSFDLMTDVLNEAQAARLAPAMELVRRALDRPAAPAAWSLAWAKLDPESQAAVDRVFANVGLALAEHLRGIAADQSPFDRFAARVAAGKKPEEALDTGFGETELAGLGLFDGSLGCGGCHAGPTFSDQRFHNLGLPAQGNEVDFGRAVALLARADDPLGCAGTLLKPDDVGAWPVSCERPDAQRADMSAMLSAFRTPTLRNVQETAPYMHDGRFASLTQVLDFYDEPSGKPGLGHRVEAVKRLDLTREERQALTAFLGALSSPVRDGRTGRMTQR